MSDTALSYYRKKHAEYSDQLKEIRQRLRIFVFLRLALFILMVFIPLAFVRENPRTAVLVFMLLFAAFLALVKYYSVLERRSRYVSSLVDVNLGEIEAFRGNLSSFADGRGYADPDHPYSLDLDLFGSDSLFQYLNRTCTLAGRDCLAGMLLEPASEAPQIRRRQKAFTEMSTKPDFCQQFMATGRMHKEGQTDRFRLLKYVNSPSRFTRNYTLLTAAKLLPALTIGILVFTVAGILPVAGFLIMFFLQLILTGVLLKHINEMHELVTNRLNTLRKYGELLHIIHNSGFDAPLLKSLQRHLRKEGTPPSGHIRKLSKIVEAFDNRLNIIAAVFLNGLLLWDINCVLMLERWNRRHRKHLPVWLESIARMDAYVSFAVYSFNNPDFVIPRLLDDGKVIQADRLGHPLIRPKDRVCNDFSVDERGRFIIITGANMAGKSTFLRTVGVALVFAMAGAPVCAREFGFRIMDIYSSMRTSDSLKRNESYFYAELKRLKDLIDRLAGGREVFILLDEILKGTNTIDKQKGSVALLERMLNMGATGIVATHDQSLAALEDDFPGRIVNKSFEVEIEGERIYFDYLLRDGVTRKMNALILMKQMGLLMDREMSRNQSSG
ncbi:MAG: hypothetical protein R6U58_00185 [Bacteroidales bacterium]